MQHANSENTTFDFNFQNLLKIEIL